MRRMAPASSDSASPPPGHYKAMLSSTAFDLPEHRAAAREACIDAGVFPVGMESLPARDATGVVPPVELEAELVDVVAGGGVDVGDGDFGYGLGQPGGHEI